MRALQADTLLKFRFYRVHDFYLFIYLFIFLLLLLLFFFFTVTRAY